MAALMTCVLMFDGNLGRLHAFKNADVSEMNPRVETSSVNSATFEWAIWAVQDCEMLLYLLI